MPSRKIILAICTLIGLCASIPVIAAKLDPSGETTIEQQIQLTIQKDTPLSEKEYILHETSKKLTSTDQIILWLNALAKLPRQAAIHILQADLSSPTPLSKLPDAEKKLDAKTFKILRSLLPESDGSIALFNEESFEGWKITDTNNKQAWVLKDGVLSCLAYSNLRSEYPYGNLELSFEVSFEENSNNGIGFRAKGNQINEIQILDDEGSWHKGIIQDYQHHGSLYGIMPAKPGTLKPLGEWNSMKITIKDRYCIVESNGKTIVDGNMDEALDKMKKRDGHSRSDTFAPLQNNIGELMFMGHDGPVVRFRNVRIRNLDPIVLPEMVSEPTTQGF